MKLLYRLFCLVYAAQQGATRRLTPVGWGVLALTALAALVGLDTKQTTAGRIFALLLSMLAIAIIYSLRFRWRFSVERNLPQFATVGTKLRYTVVIHNRTHKKQTELRLLENFVDYRPSYLEFKQLVRLEREKHNFVYLSILYYQWLVAIASQRKATTKSAAIPTVLPQGKAKIMVEIEPTHRGVMRLAGVTVARRDPFGLFNACKTVSLPQALLILPKRYQLPPLSLPGGKNALSGAVATTASAGDAEEFVSLRDYRPGDPLRKIHWKSWAKTDKPIIKEEQHEDFVRQALILDNFHSAKESEALEEAISVAASFACNFQTQESLLDLLFVEGEAYYFTGGKGLENAAKMLEILANVTACSDRPFEDLVETVMSKISLLSGCICIFLNWNETRQQLVDYIRSSNIPVLVLVIIDREATDNKFYGENIHCLKVGKIQEDLANKLAAVF